MPLLRRRTPLPDDVRTCLNLQRRERILAWAPLTNGWAVATTHGLRVLLTAGEQMHRPWTEVSTARLDPDAAVLTVNWVDGAAPSPLALADNRSMEFPRVLRQCVNSSLVHTEQVTLPSGAVARVALRRDADDVVVTQVLGTAEVDLSDPATAAAIDAAEVRVRDAVGLR